MSDSAPQPEAEAANRHIRSFVLRQGRMTDAQRIALERDWPRFGLDWPRPAADPASWFDCVQPVVLEIGFGNGEALRAAALADRERNYLGIEVHRPGVGRLLRELATTDLRNAKVISADAFEVLRDGILPATLDELRLYFPDPWPKARQNKRRIVQPAFVDLVASRLRAGGRFHLATDWAPYAEWMRQVLDASPVFSNTADASGYVPRPEGRIETHFERRGLKLGHQVFDLVYVRRGVE